MESGARGEVVKPDAGYDYDVVNVTGPTFLPLRAKYLEISKSGIALIGYYT